MFILRFFSQKKDEEFVRLFDRCGELSFSIFLQESLIEATIKTLHEKTRMFELHSLLHFSEIGQVVSESYALQFTYTHFVKHSSFFHEIICEMPPWHRPLPNC